MSSPTGDGDVASPSKLLFDSTRLGGSHAGAYNENLLENPFSWQLNEPSADEHRHDGENEFGATDDSQFFSGDFTSSASGSPVLSPPHQHQQQQASSAQFTSGFMRRQSALPPAQLNISADDFSADLEATIEKMRDKSQLVYTRRRQLQHEAAERLRQQGGDVGGRRRGGGGAGAGGRRATLVAGRSGSGSPLPRSTSQRRLLGGGGGANSKSSTSFRRSQSSTMTSLSANFSGAFVQSAGDDLFGPTFGESQASGVFDPLAATFRSSGHGSSSAGTGRSPGNDGDDDMDNENGDPDDAPEGMTFKRFEDLLWRYGTDKIPNKKVIKILLRRAHVTDRCKELIASILALNDDEADFSPLQQQQPPPSSPLADPDLEDSARKNSGRLKKQQKQRTSIHNNNSGLGDAPECHVMMDSSFKLIDVICDSNLGEKPWLDLPALPSKCLLDIAEFWKDLQRFVTELSLQVENSFWNRTKSKRDRNELRAAREVAALLCCLGAVMQYRRQKARLQAAAAAKKRPPAAASSSSHSKRHKKSEETQQQQDGAAAAADSEEKQIKVLAGFRFLLSTSCGILVGESAAEQQLRELFPEIELDIDEERQKRERAVEKKRAEMLKTLEAQAEAEEQNAAATAAGVVVVVPPREQVTDAMMNKLVDGDHRRGEEDQNNNSSNKSRRKRRASLVGLVGLEESSDDEDKQHKDYGHDHDDDDDSEAAAANHKEGRGASPIAVRRTKFLRKRKKEEFTQRLCERLFEQCNQKLKHLRIVQEAEEAAAFPGQRRGAGAGASSPSLLSSHGHIAQHRTSIFDVPALMENFEKEIKTIDYSHLPIKRPGNNSNNNRQHLPALLASPDSATLGSPSALPALRHHHQHPDVDDDDFFLTTPAGGAPSPIKTVAVVEPQKQHRSNSLSVIHQHQQVGDEQQQQPQPRRRRLSMQLVPTSVIAQAAVPVANCTQATLLASRRRRNQCGPVTPDPRAQRPRWGDDSIGGGGGQQFAARALTPASYASSQSVDNLTPVRVATGPWQQHVRSAVATFEKSSNKVGRAINCLSPAFESSSAMGQARALRSQLRQLQK